MEEIIGSRSEVHRQLGTRTLATVPAPASASVATPQKGKTRKKRQMSPEAKATGTISFFGSPCFVSAAVSGSFVGSTLLGTLSVGGAQIGTLNGNFTLSSGPGNISGSYGIVSGSCAGDLGRFSVSRIL